MQHYCKYSSKNLRQDPLFLRNDFLCSDGAGMPIISRCGVDVSNIQLMAADHVRINETSADIAKTIHFFVEDKKIERYYNIPDKYPARLAQYAHVLTPDYSLYTDMPIPIQVMNVFKSRWCGAYWQECGLSVIPTVSWSTASSYSFCFDGLEYGSVVAISTLGNLLEKNLFLSGYFALKERINPKQVLCFGRPFREMGNEVIFVDYLETSRRKK